MADPDFKQLRKDAETLIEKLEAIAKGLDVHHTNVAITRATGGTTGALGGLMGFALCLAPFTAGTSAIAAGAIGAAGAALSLAGGLTSTGGQAVEELINWSALKKATLLLKEFLEQLKRQYVNKNNCPSRAEALILRFILQTATAFMFEQLGMSVLAACTSSATSTKVASKGALSTTSGVTRSVQAGGKVTTQVTHQVTKSGARAVTTTTTQSAATVSGVARGLACATAFLNVAGVGLSVYDAVTGVRDLKSKSSSKAADIIRQDMITIVKDLLQQLDDILATETPVSKLLALKAQMNGLK